MKVTLNVLENRGRDADRHWPAYMFGGRVRTSTLVLIVAFFVVWWTYDTNRPAPTAPAAPQFVPPGFVPDPAYTWVPRSRVQAPPTYDTPTPTWTPTTTVPTTTTPPPPTTTPPTTTPPPLFQLPVLPPPFGPGTTTPAPPPPGQVPGPPSPAPPPLFPGLPG
ncbi:MAG: hypothetical protein WB777_16100 [Mycobacterium sp.]